MVTNTLAWYGATDLYSWWWSGHVIRQGGDPYQAYFDHTVIELPVRYLDGFVVHSLPISRGLPAVPTNSPPMLFLLHLLSYLSWDTAKVTWMLLNMAMVATIPWLVLRLLPVRLNALFQLIIILAFYGMLGPRMAVAQGQTSPLVFLLMLSTLLWVRKQHRWLPGVALGIALSKFSVAIPLFLLLVHKRKWSVIAIGLLVQVLGFAGMAFLGERSPMDSLLDYVSITSRHAAAEGIHLTGMYSASTMVIVLIGITFSFATLVPIWFYSRQHSKGPNSELRDYAVFAALSLWALLVAFHQAYDLMLAILAIALLLGVVRESGRWHLSPLQLLTVFVLFIATIAVLSLPGRFLEVFIGSYVSWWLTFLVGAITTSLIVLLGACLLLLRQLSRLPSASTGLPTIEGDS